MNVYASPTRIAAVLLCCLTSFLMPTGHGQNIDFATTFGGSDGNTTVFASVHKDGAYFVTGVTMASDFPVTDNSVFQGDPDGVGDIFVAKLDANGNLVAATLLGGSGTDFANGIVATDDFGTEPLRITISGWTRSTDFPTLDPIQAENGGKSDAIIAQFDEDLNLLFSTYLGGSEDDQFAGVVVRTLFTDNFVFFGFSNSTDFPFPASNGAFAVTSKTNPNSSSGLVVTMFGDRTIRMATLLQVSPGSQFNAVLLGATPRVIEGRTDGVGFTGWTDHPTFFRHATDPVGEGRKIIYTEIDHRDGGRLYSRVISGSGDDIGHSLTRLGDNRVLIVGQTTSPDFPGVGDGPGSEYGGDTDAIAVVLGPLPPFGNPRPPVSAYLGGAGLDIARSVVPSTRSVFEAEGTTQFTALVGGVTGSTDFPIPQSSLAIQPHFGGGEFDGFLGVVRVRAFSAAPSSSIEFGPMTYIGGSGDDAVTTLELMGDTVEEMTVFAGGATNAEDFFSPSSTKPSLGKQNHGSTEQAFALLGTLPLQGSIDPITQTGVANHIAGQFESNAPFTLTSPGGSWFLQSDPTESTRLLFGNLPGSDGRTSALPGAIEIVLSEADINSGQARISIISGDEDSEPDIFLFTGGANRGFSTQKETRPAHYIGLYNGGVGGTIYGHGVLLSGEEIAGLRFTPNTPFGENWVGALVQPLDENGHLTQTTANFPGLEPFPVDSLLNNATVTVQVLPDHTIRGVELQGITGATITPSFYSGGSIVQPKADGVEAQDSVIFYDPNTLRYTSEEIGHFVVTTNVAPAIAGDFRFQVAPSDTVQVGSEDPDTESDVPTLRVVSDLGTASVFSVGVFPENVSLILPDATTPLDSDTPDGTFLGQTANPPPSIRIRTATIPGDQGADVIYRTEYCVYGDESFVGVAINSTAPQPPIHLNFNVPASFKFNPEEIPFVPVVYTTPSSTVFTGGELFTLSGTSNDLFGYTRRPVPYVALNDNQIVPLYLDGSYQLGHREARFGAGPMPPDATRGLLVVQSGLGGETGMELAGGNRARLHMATAFTGGDRLEIEVQLTPSAPAPNSIVSFGKLEAGGIQQIVPLNAYSSSSGQRGAHLASAESRLIPEGTRFDIHLAVHDFEQQSFHGVGPVRFELSTDLNLEGFAHSMTEWIQHVFLQALGVSVVCDASLVDNGVLFQLERVDGFINQGAFTVILEFPDGWMDRIARDNFEFSAFGDTRFAISGDWVFVSGLDLDNSTVRIAPSDEPGIQARMVGLRLTSDTIVRWTVRGRVENQETASTVGRLTFRSATSSPGLANDGIAPIQLDTEFPGIDAMEVRVVGLMRGRTVIEQNVPVGEAVAWIHSVNDEAPVVSSGGFTEFNDGGWGYFVQFEPSTRLEVGDQALVSVDELRLLPVGGSAIHSIDYLEMDGMGMDSIGIGSMAPPPPVLNVSLLEGELVLDWEGEAQLMHAGRLTDIFAEVPEATSPYVVPMGDEEGYFLLMPIP